MADRIVRYGVYALVSGVPLVYSGWATTYPKWFLFDLVVALLLTLRGWQWARGSRALGYRPRLLAPGVTGLTVAAVASLGAWNPWWAAVALYHLAHALALYLLVVDLVAERSSEAGIVWLVILTAGVASLLGLYQYLVPGSFYEWGVGGRFQAAAGNTNYAAAYFIIMLWPALGIAAGGHTWLQRSVAGGLAVLLGVSLLLTNARAGWLSALAGAAATILLFAWFRLRSTAASLDRPPTPVPRPLPWRRWLRVGAFGLGTLVVLGAGSALLRVKGYTIAERVASLRDLTDPSLYARFSLLRDTVRMIADRPLLGFGAGHYQIEFPPYTRLADEAILRSAIAEHPHNEYLNILAETGLLGFAALLWALWRVGGTARDALFRSLEDSTFPAALGLTGGILCAGIYSAFIYSFHVADALVTLVVLLGVMEGLRGEVGESTLAREEEAGDGLGHRGGRWRPRVRMAMVGGFAVVEGLAVAAFAFRPMASEAFFRLGYVLINAGRGKEATAALERSVAWYPGNFSSAFQAAGVLFDEKDYSGALVWAERSLAGNHNLLLAFSIVGGVRLVRREQAEAAAVFKRALMVNPGYTTGLNNLGGLYLEQGRLSEARLLFARAIAAYPTRTHGYLNLALLEWRSGNLSEAQDLLGRATLLDPSLGRSWYYLASVSALLGQADEALAALSRAVATDRAWGQRAMGDGSFATLKATARFRQIVSANLDAAPLPAKPKGGS